MSRPFCPHCGFDLKQDTPILINKFSMFGPGAPLCYEGAPLNLTTYQALFCWTLMKAAPHPVQLGVIVDRIGSEADDEVTRVFACKIRQRLRLRGIAAPFRSARYGNKPAYRWIIR